MVGAMTRVAGATREKYEPGTSAGGRSRWTRVGVIVAVLTCGISESRLAWADPAQVESLIAEGNELRRQGRNALAVPVFKKAFDLDQTPRTAGQLGLAELAASYPVEAADHLSLALESPDHPWVASNRKSLEKALTKAKSSVAEVMVDGSPRGAIVMTIGTWHQASCQFNSTDTSFDRVSVVIKPSPVAWTGTMYLDNVHMD